ncbi:MAG: VTC domain-containing protein [Candidatus Omnitrophica bacterium]|nr:VTC domain-containing protein [Candidatus Omnitrophota bacterium]
MRRERFEIKYYFSLVQLDELIRFIQPFMVLDKYSDCRDKVGSYKISSLYFDSDHFDFYRTCALPNYGRICSQIKYV